MPAIDNSPAAIGLAERALAVLCAADPADKVRLSRAAAADWRAGETVAVGRARPPDRPARPDRPHLAPPRAMPRRRTGGGPGHRIALLHAIAHIELNAIDLAWDLIARFTNAGLPRAFYDDWVTVACQEANHFDLLAHRLADLDSAYGDLPAHDGLWQAAADTAGDLAARLAVVPLVLEARGLDVTPAMVARLERHGDGESAAVLRLIYREEIGHVATGQRWFEHVCAARGVAPAPTFQRLVRRHFKGLLKPPFNTAARAEAGMDEQVYLPLAEAPR